MSKGSERSVRRDKRRLEAVKWFVIREPHQELSPALQKKWDRWAADAKNLADFREYEQVDKLLRSLPRKPLPTEAELHAHFARAESSGSGAEVRWRWQWREPTRRAHVVAASLALVALVAIGVGLVLGPPRTSPPRSVQEREFQTTPGQQRKLTLPDHSVVRLGGATRLSVLVSGDIRRVTLYEGEAMFNVTDNPRVPFQVDIEATRVTALGTAFHVRRYTDGQVIVGVAQGSVAVSASAQSNAQLRSVKVKAGQAVSSDSSGWITPAHPADFQAVTWWLYGRRVYREKPLGKVIEDLQLYFPRHIEYDPALDSFPFTGVIDPNKPEEWVLGLKEIFPVEIDDSSPQRVIIRCRQADCR